MITRKNPVRRAFTLIEILIVVVILGILAAIVIPQFTTASDDAMDSSARSQLQTVRSQVELFRVQEAGALPDFTVVLDNGWGDLLSSPSGRDYLQDEPMNPYTGTSDICICAAGAAANSDGWRWDAATDDMYVLDGAGGDL